MRKIIPILLVLIVFQAYSQEASEEKRISLNAGIGTSFVQGDDNYKPRVCFHVAFNIILNDNWLMLLLKYQHLFYDYEIKYYDGWKDVEKKFMFDINCVSASIRAPIETFTLAFGPAILFNDYNNKTDFALAATLGITTNICKPFSFDAGINLIYDTVTEDFLQYVFAGLQVNL